MTDYILLLARRYIFGVKFNFCFYSGEGWRQTDCIQKKKQEGVFQIEYLTTSGTAVIVLVI